MYVLKCFTTPVGAHGVIPEQPLGKGDGAFKETFILVVQDSK